MKVFVTGASGWVGSATVADLLEAGHQVLGLARSDESAAAVEAAGAEVLRGSLEDLDSLKSGAEAADGVIHTAYIHDFSDMEGAAKTDLAAIGVFAEALEGTDKPLVISSGVATVAPGQVATEDVRPEPSEGGHPRVQSEADVLGLADKGVRSSVVRLSPTVHGDGDHGFMAMLVQIAREKGEAAYVGDGDNHWPAVHRFDAARLYRLGLESAPAGSILHGVAEEGVPTRAIAEAIGHGLDLPVISVSAEATMDHFGWLGMFFGMDIRASSAKTRELLSWEPTHQGLIEDLNEGHYFN